MRRIPLILGAFLSLLFLLASGCREPQGATWQRIEESGVLRVGVDPTYPPFAVAEGGDVRGLDADLARAVAADLGLEAQFTYFGFDGLYDALATEQVDVLISAMVVAPHRMKDFAYSDPYFNAGQLLLTPAGETEIEEMRDLRGRTVAVELGSPGHMAANQWQRRVPDLTVNRYDTPDAALDAVAAGRAEAAIVDGISARLYLGANDGVQVAGDPVTVEPYAMVVRIEDELLLEKLNESLDRLQESGRLDRMIRRWLGTRIGGS
ncbi:MAG: transporter substrate-binding domain-containing protein [Candidatus Promineifilaceae bacterium]|nr:transporter substrate-binding domain-containing protein [Candidatus Promineifilaceae bacterium]